MKSDLKFEHIWSTWSQGGFKNSGQQWTRMDNSWAEWREAAPRFRWRGPEFAPTFLRTLLPAEDFDYNVMCRQQVLAHVLTVSAVFHAVRQPISVSIGDTLWHSGQAKNASRWSNPFWAEASIRSCQLVTLQPHSPACAFVFAVSSTGAGNISALSSTPQLGLAKLVRSHGELVTMCDGVWR